MRGCVEPSHEPPCRVAGLDHPRGRAMKLRAALLASVVMAIVTACSGCAELIEASDSCDDGRWRGFDHQTQCTERLKRSLAERRDALTLR
jgi:hypothetical protein